jgi:hypothetical protein
MTEFQITNPEPFVIGSGQQKYPGGYIGKVLINGQLLFETLESTPTQCKNTCIFWCISQPQNYVPPSPVTTTFPS